MHSYNKASVGDQPQASKVYTRFAATARGGTAVGLVDGGSARAVGVIASGVSGLDAGLGLGLSRLSKVG